jgi:hypothetical protein
MTNCPLSVFSKLKGAAMLRIAFATALVLTAAPALAGDQSLYPHTHEPAIIGSKTVPFHYRPVGEVYIVRTGAYDESTVKFSGRNTRQSGRSDNPTGDAVTEILIHSN